MKRFLFVALTLTATLSFAAAEELAVVDGVVIERKHVDEFVSRQLEALSRERGGTVSIPDRLKQDVATASLGDLVSSVAFARAARRSGYADDPRLKQSLEEARKGKLGAIDEDLLLAFLWNEKLGQDAILKSTEADLREFWGRLTEGADYKVKVLSFATEEEAKAAKAEAKDSQSFAAIEDRPEGEGKPFVLDARIDSGFLWKWRQGIDLGTPTMGDIGGPVRAKSGTWSIWIVEGVINRPRRKFESLAEPALEVLRAEYAAWKQESVLNEVLRTADIQWKVERPSLFAAIR